MRRGVACLTAAVVLNACRDGAKGADAADRLAQFWSLGNTAKVITAPPDGVNVLGQRAAP